MVIDQEPTTVMAVVVVTAHRRSTMQSLLAQARRNLATSDEDRPRLMQMNSKTMAEVVTVAVGMPLLILKLLAEATSYSWGILVATGSVVARHHHRVVSSAPQLPQWYQPPILEMMADTMLRLLKRQHQEQLRKKKK